MSFLALILKEMLFFKNKQYVIFIKIKNSRKQVCLKFFELFEKLAEINKVLKLKAIGKWAQTKLLMKVAEFLT